MGVSGIVSNLTVQEPYTTGESSHGTLSSPSRDLVEVVETSQSARETNATGLPRVLFLYPVDATFVRSDLNLLNGFCRVTPFHLTANSSCTDLRRGVRDADLVFSWFASGHTATANVLARLTGRKCVTVAGGWDVARMPEIGYGYLNRFRGRVAARVALAAANLILAFSRWSETRIRSVAPKSIVRTVYMGVDTTSFRPSLKEPLVVSVANISRENLVRKGLFHIVEAAREVADTRFVIVGRDLDGSLDELKRKASGNVEFTGWLPDDELRSILARASVYLQPSYTEGFGVAIAEAMASGCVPVVTKAGAIPEVVGGAGIYVPYGRPKALAGAIVEGLASGLGPRARQRVVENFTLKHRLAALRECISDVLSSTSRESARPMTRGG